MEQGKQPRCFLSAAMEVVVVAQICNAISTRKFWYSYKGIQFLRTGFRVIVLVCLPKFIIYDQIVGYFWNQFMNVNSTVNVRKVCQVCRSIVLCIALLSLRLF